MQVTNISRYPVKSMRGEALDSVTLGFTGLPLDRAFAFVQDGLHTPFPWLTGRECPRMLECEPIVGDGRWPSVRVRTPDGEFDLGSDAFRAKLLEWSGRAATLHSDHRGCQDVAYVSVISTATIRELSATAGVEPDYRRFRMNFVVDTGADAFKENEWLGRELQVGAARLAVLMPDKRCQMITLDPESGISTPGVLKAAADRNGACAGVYCSVLAPGPVSTGDGVEVI